MDFFFTTLTKGHLEVIFAAKFKHPISKKKLAGNSNFEKLAGNSNFGGKYRYFQKIDNDEMIPSQIPYKIDPQNSTAFL
jgi:hypothetical protein